jgi:hypothetical protein
MKRSESIFLTVKKKVIDCRRNGLCRKGYIKYLRRTAELSDGIVTVESAKVSLGRKKRSPPSHKERRAAWITHA